MADAQATFAISLQDQMSAPANKAANALQQLQKKIDDETNALAAMQKAMRQMQKGTVVNVEAFKKLKDQITAKRSAIADLTTQYVKLGGNFTKTAPKVNVLSQKLGQFGNVTNALGSPVGGLVGQVQGLSTALAGSGGVVIAAGLAAAAVAALGAAVVAAAAKLTQLVIAASDAARSQRLLLEGLTGSTEGANALSDTINRVSQNVALSSEEVSSFARQLYQAGLRGSQLEAALEAASVSASVLGSESASSFIEQAKQLRNTSGAVEKLSKDITSKLGGTAQKQLLSLSVQSRKLKESIGQIFASATIEPFLKAISTVTSMFNETSATGQALRTMVSTIFDPFFKSTESGAPIVKALIQGIVIAALQMTIVFLKVRNAIRDAFGGESKSSIDWANLAMKAGQGLAYAFAASIGAIVTIMGALAAVWATLMSIGMAVWFTIGKAIGFTIDAVKFVWNAFTGFVEWIAGLNFSEIASNIIRGLVNGLKNGAGLVADALKGVASNALKSFKGVFGIASPSKVMMEMGNFLGEGTKLGIEESSGDVESAMTDMISIPSEITATADSAGGGDTITNSSSSSASTVVNITINANGGDAEGIAANVKRAMADVLEGVVINMGSPSPEPA